MCELVSAATMATIVGEGAAALTVMDALAVGGTLFGAMSYMQQGDAASKAGEYNAAVARNNQIIANQQAEDALRRGEIAEAEQRRKSQTIKGAQRAALGASGVQLDSGSPLDILGDTAAFGELDALTIRNNAQREAYGYRVQGMNFEAEAGLATARGQAAQQSAMIGAGGTLLSGMASAGDRWYRRGFGGATPGRGPTTSSMGSNAWRYAPAGMGFE